MRTILTLTGLIAGFAAVILSIVAFATGSDSWHGHNTWCGIAALWALSSGAWSGVTLARPKGNHQEISRKAAQ